jgi:hypothetical protein
MTVPLAGSTPPTTPYNEREEGADSCGISAQRCGCDAFQFSSSAWTVSRNASTRSVSNAAAAAS